MLPADVDMSIVRVDQLPDVLLIGLQEMLYVQLYFGKKRKKF